MAMRGRLPQKNEATHVFLVLWKAYRAIFAKSNESRKHLGLEVLLHKGPLPVNVIGEKVELTTGSITTAVDRMEAKWLVVRKNHSEDRRVRLVELTAKGRRFMEKAYVQHSIEMEKAMTILSREDRAVLVELLKRLGKGKEEAVVRRLRAVR
jgi:MarR family transcriptional regulator, 2-MHQ and catechol-resistance regulon repressor